MRICIWYDLSPALSGGANSFIGSLAGELQNQGHHVHFRPQVDSDVVLINSWSRGPNQFLGPQDVVNLRAGASWLPSALVRLFGYRRRFPPLIHRLDGVAHLYGRFDGADDRQMSINPLTDGTIFQSTYCQESFHAQGIVPCWSRIIHNGVDPKIFPPPSSQKVISGRLKLLAVSWSNNPLKGFSLLVNLAEQSHVSVTFVGNWCSSIAPGKVQLLGVKSRSEIAALMQEHDVFVHAADNDPCPNVVIEALASGLPVLYKNSGGTRELADGYGVSLSEDNSRDISLLLDNYFQIRERLLSERPRFLIETSAQQYVEAFATLKDSFGHA